MRAFRFPASRITGPVIGSRSISRAICGPTASDGHAGRRGPLFRSASVTFASGFCADGDWQKRRPSTAVPVGRGVRAYPEARTVKFF